MFSVGKVSGIFAATFLAFSLTGCSVIAGLTTNEDQAVTLGNSWGETLATRDPQRITNQYAPDAVLLATFTDKISTQEDRVKYFEGLAKNSGLRVEYNTQVPSVLAGDSVSLSGLYTFMYEDKKGKTVKAPARYTFVWEKRGGEWKIITHHSSLRPEKTKK